MSLTQWILLISIQIGKSILVNIKFSNNPPHEWKLTQQHAKNEDTRESPY